MDTDIIFNCLTNKTYENITELEYELIKISDKRLAYGFILHLMINKLTSKDINRRSLMELGIKLIPEDILGKKASETLEHFSVSMKPIFETSISSKMFVVNFLNLIGNDKKISPDNEEEAKTLINNNQDKIPFLKDYLLEEEMYEYLILLDNLK